MNRNSYYLKTFGCKLNTYDSLAIEGGLESLGYERNETSPEVMILNTCTVTHDADQGFRRDVRRLAKKLKPKLIMVTGCLAQTDPEGISRDWGGVEVFVYGNSERKTLLEAMNKRLTHNEKLESLGWKKVNVLKKRLKEEEIFTGLPPKDSLKTRAILKIQEGCEVMCTFCVIPLARGRSRSRRVDELITEIKEFENSGFKEVVITGTHLPDYRDGRVRLRELLEKLLKSTKHIRIRISSLEPPYVTREILDLMKNESRFCPHLHLSIQSTEDGILERMNRDYGKKEIEDCMNRITAFDERLFVGMDLISCFPGETDEDHRNTMNFLQNNPWTKIHVFPYSPRKGTPAALYEGQVKTHQRGPRVKELLALSESRLRDRSDLEVGKIHEVLGEKQKLSRPSEGTSEYFWKVQMDKGAIIQNQLLRAKITAVKKPGILIGKPL